MAWRSHFVIARERSGRGDPVNNKVARSRVRALFTGLLRFTRNDKRVWSLFVSCHREGATRPWRSSYNRVAHTRVHYLLDCFVSLAMTRECGRYSFHVIARGAVRPWRSSYNRVAHTRVHYLLDCFVSLAMTREGVWRGMTMWK